MHSFAIAKLKFTALCTSLVLATGAAGFVAVGGWGHPGQDGAKAPENAFVGRQEKLGPAPRQPAPTKALPGSKLPGGGAVGTAGALSSDVRHKADDDSFASAKSPQETREALRRVTDKFRNGLDPLALEEHLDFISKSFGVTFIIDDRAFKQQDANADVAKKEVMLRKTPRVKAETVLRTLLSQIEGAAFIVKGDHILITTEEKVNGNALLQESISFEAKEGQTLEQALRELSDEHGVTILLDVRASEQGKTPIKGRMQNVSLQVAVRLLAEMGDLKAVTVGNAMFVTDATNAYTLQQEEGGNILPPTPTAGTGARFGGMNGGPGGGLGGMPTEPAKPKKNKVAPKPTDPTIPPANLLTPDIVAPLATKPLKP